MIIFQIGPCKRLRNHLPSPIRERRAGPAFGSGIEFGRREAAGAVDSFWAGECASVVAVADFDSVPDDICCCRFRRASAAAWRSPAGGLGNQSQYLKELY
jgi:hypothetical protein